MLLIVAFSVSAPGRSNFLRPIDFLFCLAKLNFIFHSTSKKDLAKILTNKRNPTFYTVQIIPTRTG
jgi:hypothetical protein